MEGARVSWGGARNQKSRRTARAPPRSMLPQGRSHAAARGALTRGVAMQDSPASEAPKPARRSDPPPARPADSESRRRSLASLAVTTTVTCVLRFCVENGELARPLRRVYQRCLLPHRVSSLCLCRCGGAPLAGQLVRRLLQVCHLRPMLRALHAGHAAQEPRLKVWHPGRHWLLRHAVRGGVLCVSTARPCARPAPLRSPETHLAQNINPSFYATDIKQHLAHVRAVKMAPSGVIVVPAQQIMVVKQ